MYDRREPIRLPAESAPVLFVVLDTEEEFDWDAPASRDKTGVDHLLRIHRLQTLFDRFNVRPTYVVDFPVATQPNGYGPLREIADSGRCTIGAHLHPWVTPPLVEPVTGPNTFTCNLAPDLQRQKITSVCNAIQDTFGHMPRIYKAGRYGIGTDSLRVLEDLGFEVDQSIMPRFDFSAEQGPSFLDYSPEPFLFGEGRLLALPGTCEHVGLAGAAAPALYGFATSPRWSWTRLGSVLTRLRIADRLLLSPEGYTASEMKRIAKTLTDRGLRTLTMTLHSPSVEPGHTPYVRTERDLERFLDTIESFLDYFMGSLAGVTSTPQDFRRTALATTTS
jgi:hypothetical protein